ncbi:MAG: alpha/beta hydrolase [Chloroflexi bacterium]|nr:alpha/beta hydrolase [Chloroflexota bacterium]
MGVLALIFLSQLERMFIFFPTREVFYTPKMVGVAYEDVYFRTYAGQRLHGWYVPGTGDTDVTWLWFHGNGGNIGHRVEEIAQIHRRLGVNLFIFDYRGYGKSQGGPSEKATYRDARAALEYLNSRPDFAQERLVYFGRSLGAAVSVELAIEHPPMGMILVSPFASLSDMAKIAYPQIQFASWLAGKRYDSLARINQVVVPSIIIHGEQDEIVPVSQGRKLYQAANHPKQFLGLPAAGHNDTNTAGGGLYWDTLAEFLKTLSQPSQSPG